MFSSHKVQRWLVAMLCIMLLSARVDGAHLHLCLDGQESPVSVHLVDDGLDHHAPSVSAPHHDQDISLFTDAIAKSTKLKVDLPPMLLAVLLSLLLLVSYTRAPLLRRRVKLTTTAVTDLLPPLRGPPLTAVC